MGNLPKLFCFDMDGTITAIGSSWEHLSRQLNIWDDRAEHHLTAFIKGEIDYMEFCRLDAMVLSGLESSKVKNAIENIEIDPGIIGLTQHLKDKGVKLALISSGLSILADRVRSLAHFDYVFVNELEEIGGFMTGGVKVNVSIDNPKMTKKAIVSMLAVKEGLEKGDIAAIGDNWGDHGMIEEAGMKFFMNRTPEEAEKATAVFPDIIIVQDMDDVCRHLACIENS